MLILLIIQLTISPRVFGPDKRYQVSKILDFTDLYKLIVIKNRCEDGISFTLSFITLI